MAKKHPGVEPLGGGRYRIRTSMYHPKTGARAEIDRRVKAADAAEAASRLASERAAWLSKRTRKDDVARRRLREAIGEWFAEKRANVKASTASTYETAVKWWVATLGDHFLDAIEPSDVREVLAGLADAGRGSETCAGRLRVLRTFAADTKCDAMVHGVIVKRDVRDEERQEDEGRGLDLAELRAFLAAGERAYLGKNGEPRPTWRRAWALVLLMATTGLRFGEASALEWKDIGEDTIRVRRAQWRGIVDHPKAVASKRVVTIDADLAAVLREHRLAIGLSHRLVFPSRRRTSRSGYVTNGHARKAIIRVCDKAEIKIDRRPVVHMLRHTINNLLRQNTSELVRQALIGHADASQNERYSKVGMDERRAAMGAVLRMVRGE